MAVQCDFLASVADLICLQLPLKGQHTVRLRGGGTAVACGCDGRSVRFQVLVASVQVAIVGGLHDR